MAADPKILSVARAICAGRGMTLGPEVGAGAFKHTFEARTSDGTPKALKLYKRAGADARTQREVDAIRRCSHPGIARLEAIDTWNDAGEEYVFLIEEFLSGGTLTARLVAGLLTTVELRELALSLVRAVSHVAGLYLVHRDIKPDNIMYRSPGGPVVLVDFGLVRDLAQSSITKTWQPQGPGTPFFAAPEQLLNQKPHIGWRTDQFAVGVVLAVSSFGRHPYATPGLSLGQVVDRVARREEPSAEFVAWATGQGLVPLIKMVAPWPVRRYRLPRDLADAWGFDDGGE